MTQALASERHAAHARNARAVLVLAPLLLLAACAGGQRKGGDGAAGAVVDAVEAPFADLNLVGDKVPAVLKSALATPYGLPSPGDCASLATAVGALDVALGPDLDAPRAPAKGLGERGSEAVGDAAHDALVRTAEGVVPFRSWVRKLSGAERRSREVAAALAAGRARRAFLKGMGQSAGCAVPASPLVPVAGSP